MPLRRTLVPVLIAVGLALSSGAAQAHYIPTCDTFTCREHNVIHAAQLAWCGNVNRECYDGDKARRVAYCETGGTYDKWATNGQYKGLWQMGSHERETCGQTWGKDPWSQARAAKCWWRLASWSAWDCA